MSSGNNWIPIRGVGKVRIKLAARIKELLDVDVQPENIQRTNPNHRHFEDCVAWDCWGLQRGRRVQVHSWDTMTVCARKGIVRIGHDSIMIEVCQKD